MVFKMEELLQKLILLDLMMLNQLKSAVGVSTFEADVLLDDGTKLTNLISGNLRLSNTSGNTGIITSSGTKLCWYYNFK